MKMKKMLLSPSELLSCYQKPAKRKFGQNFLTDPRILDRILDAANITAGSRVLEIGPGVGGLTTRLLARKADVQALEHDRDLVNHLQKVFASSPELSVTQGDALTDILYDLLGDPARIVVANLPYNIATEILFRLIDGPKTPEIMVLMFQREVAERIVAAGSTRKFGLLSIAVQLTYQANIVLQLPPGAFTPRPKVSSAVVRFRRRERYDRDMRKNIRKIARIAFGKRRKMLRKSLRSLVKNPIPWLHSANIPPTARPEALFIDDFARLAEKSKIYF